MANRLLDGDPQETIEETGRAPETLRATYDSAIYQIMELLRLRLMESGFDCRFKTSGYTTDAYAKPPKPKVAAKKLLKDLNDTKTWFDASPADALLTSTAAERIELAKSYNENAKGHTPTRNDRVHLTIPIYDPKSNTMLGFSPYEAGPLSVSSVPKGMESWLRSLTNRKDLVAVPRTKKSEAWFQERQKLMTSNDRFVIVVDADEFANATGEDCVLTVNSDTLEGDSLVAAHYTPQPSMSP
jgi:hypothetical protein